MILTPNVDFTPARGVDYVLNNKNTPNFKTVFEIYSTPEVERLISDEEFVGSLLTLGSGNVVGILSSTIKWVTTGQGPSVPGLGFVYPTTSGWVGLSKNTTPGAVRKGLKSELDFVTFSGQAANTAPDYIVSLEGEPYHKSLYHYRIYSSVWVDFFYIMQCFTVGYRDKAFGYAQYLGLDVINSFNVSLNVPSAGYVSSLLTGEEVVLNIRDLLKEVVTVKTVINEYRYLPGTPHQAHKLFGGQIYANGPVDSYTTSFFLEGVNPEMIGNISRFRAPKSVAEKYMADMINLTTYYDLWKQGEGGYPTSLLLSQVIGSPESYRFAGAPFEIAEKTRTHITLGEVGWPTLNRKASLPVGATAGDVGVKVFALRPFVGYGIPYGLTVNGCYIPNAVINTIFIDIEPVRGGE